MAIMEPDYVSSVSKKIRRITVTTYIGDVHGLYTPYKRIIRQYPNTIALGDMGLGFRRFNGSWRQNPPHKEMVRANARFIRGNHDNPESCRRHSQWLADGTIEDGKMFIGGAFSIDKEFRLEGHSWWEDEELSQADMRVIAETYLRCKPHTMVTHDAPITAIAQIHNTHHLYDNSRTQQFLQSLWNEHKPKLWIFGHHHRSFDQVIEGTRFVCLAELEVKDL